MSDDRLVTESQPASDLDRELLHLSLRQLHEKGRQFDHLREQHRRLRAEYRELREATLRDDRRAA